MKTTLEEENRRLREMCKKYLAWAGVVKDVNVALEEDLNNPEMWQTSDNSDYAKSQADLDNVCCEEAYIDVFGSHGQG